MRVAKGPFAAGSAQAPLASAPAAAARHPASPPGPPPMPRREILARYRRLRQISKEQHEAVLDIIAPNVVLDWARRLDLTQGRAMVLETSRK